jgi:hypothetical protein
MFFPFRFDRQHDVALAAPARRLIRDILPMVALAIALSSCLACSSLSKSSPDTWSSSYFQNPDRVWATILETLIELDYEVAESNRPDGTLRTEPQAGEENAGVMLSINQVVYTADQVNVYIKPSAGDPGDTIDPGVLKAAADQFKAALDKNLQG